MTWDDSNAPVPGYGAAPGGPAQPFAGPAGFGQVVHPTAAPQPAGAMSPTQAAPLAPFPGLGQAPPMPTMPQLQPAANGGTVPQQGAGMTSPQPAARPMYAGHVPGPMPSSAPAAQDSDKPDAHDDVWIERTKRAIAETQNDPYRQVQLIQHLNKLYLKERFGREVQADRY